MRKLYWTFLVAISLVIFLFLFVRLPESRAADDSLQLISPASCPASGCAPGQRLNFEIAFTVSPKNANPNTQVCIYTPIKPSPTTQPWGNAQLGSISDAGLTSGVTYQIGQQSNVCEANIDGNEEWLLGGYTQLQSTTTDQLGFSLNIDQNANFDGYVRAKVFQLSPSTGQWVNMVNLKVDIEISQKGSVLYVAKDENDCGSFEPCFVNSGDDLANGVGTGLRDAVMAAANDNEIHILKDYLIKSHTVLIDKPLIIRGQENAFISYQGISCSNSMLLFNQGGTLTGLTINDGNCNNPSRDLIEVNSVLPVSIENNTLLFGKRAIFIRAESSDVTVAYNHITNQDNFAVFREASTSTSTGHVNIFANNIFDNQASYQVDCNNNGIANHNFWGENESATANAINCLVNNGKQLGASILLSTDTAGVQAQKLTVSSDFSYAFDEKIGAKRTSGTDFDIIIANHGQGLISNIPFFQHGSGNIQPCSNFYDVFLAEETTASNLTLSFKYNLNADCTAKIESNDFCGSADSQKYPLWWYDPATNATNEWTRTGQKPLGPGAAGTIGQETSCHKNVKEIRVIIDNTGRPNISTDLGFTPFVVGLPFINGVTLTNFTGQYDGSSVNLDWTTSREINVKGFYVLRSDQINGPFGRVSNLINAVGNQTIGGIYKFKDSSVTPGRTYYYKIEVIGKDDKSIATHGPISATTILGATPTRTITPTATPTGTITAINTFTPTKTNTPYIYRSPTPIYRPPTSTPGFNPTRIRTFGPTPTGARTRIIEPTSTRSEGYPIPGTSLPGDFDTPQPDNGYPAPEFTFPVSDAYPNPETSTLDPFKPTPTLTTTQEITPESGLDVESELPAQTIRWVFILVGMASGLSLLGALGVILAGRRF